MNAVQVGQKNYGMPPREGFTVAHFLPVADINRSARFYEKVFGGRVLSTGDSEGAPAYIQIANTWLLVNVGGGPTPDKPTVTLSVPDPDKINGFMNIRVADSRPGPRAKSSSPAPPRRRSIRSMPSSGSRARKRTPAPTPTASLVTFSMNDEP